MLGHLDFFVKINILHTSALHCAIQYFTIKYKLMISTPFQLHMVTNKNTNKILSKWSPIDDLDFLFKFVYISPILFT